MPASRTTVIGIPCKRLGGAGIVEGAGVAGRAVLVVLIGHVGVVMVTENCVTCTIMIVEGVHTVKSANLTTFVLCVGMSQTPIQLFGVLKRMLEIKTINDNLWYVRANL
mgnify:CR=1 FL=1